MLLRQFHTEWSVLEHKLYYDVRGKFRTDLRRNLGDQHLSISIRYFHDHTVPYHDNDNNNDNDIFRLAHIRLVIARMLSRFLLSRVVFILDDFVL
jgi:hypothetical protein